MSKRDTRNLGEVICQDMIGDITALVDEETIQGEAIMVLRIGHYGNRMYLTRDRARHIAEVLGHFAETGELP